jgi:hypothetical protein
MVSVAIAACGGGDGDVVAEPAAVTAAKTDVEEAYQAYWDLVSRLESVEPAQDPELVQRATGPALTELTSELALLKLAEQLNLHGDAYAHLVLSVTLDGADSTEATLRDCFVDDTTLVDRASSDPVPGHDQATTTHLLEVKMVSRGSWQVQSIETLETFDGTARQDCSESTAG